MVIAETVLYFFYKKGIGDKPISREGFLFITMVLSLVVLTIYQLKIEVKDKTIAAIYGAGLLQFRVKPDEVLSAEIDRSNFISGFGIRITTEGMLYNIQSMDIVRVTYMKKGKKKVVKYGSDDVQGLLSAIKSEFNLA